MAALDLHFTSNEEESGCKELFINRLEGRGCGNLKINIWNPYKQIWMPSTGNYFFPKA